MGPKQKRLRKGRKIKREIQQGLEDLQSGRLNIKDVFEDPDVLGRVSIYTLLIKTPKLGPAGVKKVLQSTDVWPHDRLSNLSPKVRSEILKQLPPRVANTFKSARSKAL